MCRPPFPERAGGGACPGRVRGVACGAGGVAGRGVLSPPAPPAPPPAAPARQQRSGQEPPALPPAAMGVEGCTKCIKYLLFVFNFIFWVSPGQRGGRGGPSRPCPLNNGAPIWLARLRLLLTSFPSLPPALRLAAWDVPWGLLFFKGGRRRSSFALFLCVRVYVYLFADVPLFIDLYFVETEKDVCVRPFGAGAPGVPCSRAGGTELGGGGAAGGRCRPPPPEGCCSPTPCC